MLLPAAKLLGGVGVGGILVWPAFTSASTSADTLTSAAFLGVGKEGVKAAKANAKERKSATVGRTVFRIAAIEGVSIAAFSAIAGEEEVVILPYASMKVIAIITWPLGVVEVRLQQLPSALPWASAAGTTPSSSSSAHAQLAGGASAAAEYAEIVDDPEYAEIPFGPPGSSQHVQSLQEGQDRAAARAAGRRSVVQGLAPNSAMYENLVHRASLADASASSPGAGIYDFSNASAAAHGAAVGGHGDAGGVEYELAVGTQPAVYDELNALADGTGTASNA